MQPDKWPQVMSVSASVALWVMSTEFLILLERGPDIMTELLS